MTKKLLLMVSFLFSLISCETPDTEKEITPTLILEHTSLDFEKAGETKKVKITSTSSSFDISIGEEWCKATIKDKVISVSVPVNDGIDVRSTDITISSDGLTEKITVRQLGQSKAILINPTKISLERDASDISFQITSNVEYDIITPDWIKSSDQTRSGMVEKDHKYSVDENFTALRIDNILVKEKNDGTTEMQLQVIQKGYGEGENPIGDDIKDDIKVKVTKGKASSWQGGATIEQTFDGDYNTGYHSNWSNGSPNYFPIDLEYEFEAENIDYIIYYPPNSHNGPFKEVEIYATTEENTTLTKVQTHQFNGSTNPARVIFDTPLKNVTSILFKVISGLGDGQGFAACIEMEFFKYNLDKFDPLTLFTDISCSELKSGITLEEINSCKYGYYLRLALSMFNGTYKTDFRIAEYKAYINPNIERNNIRQAFAYSLLDNPTGMIAKEGEELVIFVGDTHGAELSIKIQNLDIPGGDGYYSGSSSYLLVEGANKIIPRNNGLIYLLYHSDTPENLEPIKIHFATGEVNGYFDSQKHSASDWSRLLDLAKDKYFDVLGVRAHLTFPTERFRETTPDGKALIDVYDYIVKEEQLLMGLVENETMFKNRMYFHVIYKAYMFATSHRTAYEVGTLVEICNVEALKTHAVWGPAHEVGHCNQTVPDLKWVTMTEVSNNIFALHVQRMFGLKSRLEMENRYDAAHATMARPYENEAGELLGPTRPYPIIGNPFEMLVPFWQLYLYFGENKDLDFYPEIHKMIRENKDLPQNSGECALQFVRFSCEVSGYNLLDFFEYWGFLAPIKQVFDDYGEKEYLITQEQVDALRADIEAKNYKPLQSEIWKITDQNVSMFD